LIDSQEGFCSIVTGDVTNRFGYGMGNWGIVVQLPVGIFVAYLIQNVKLGPGIRPSSYSVDTGGLLP
jgi:hypothetical protein